MNIKKMMAVGIVGLAFGIWAQGTVSLAPMGGGAAPGQAAAGDTIKVNGKGVGMTQAEALKDAYRDAIEKTVGLYVDAEQMVKNDELVTDQILTQSNAFIEKYEIVKESKGANGLVSVSILATVKKSALAKRLSDVMPPQSFKLGNDAQNLHAQVVTQEKRSEDAAALLKKTLDGVNPITQLVRFSLADTKMMTKEIRDAKVCYFYRFKFEVDEQKYYGEFLPPLLKVLDQISISQPRTIRLQSFHSGFQRGSPESQFLSRREEALNYINYGEGVNNRRMQELRQGRPRPADISIDGLSSIMVNNYREGAYDGVVALGTASDYWFMSYGSRSEFHPSAFQYEFPSRSSGHERRMLDTESFQVVVITEMNSEHTIAKARRYELPKGCAEVIMAWQYGLIAAVSKGSSRFPDKSRGRTAYNIVLKDRNNEDVLVRAIAVMNVALINAMAGQGKMFDGEGSRGGYGWYVTPMIHTDAKSLQRWIGFDIPRDDLSKIASISIELAQ